jgi:hypothetical protein
MRLVQKSNFCPRGNIVSPASGAGQSRRFGCRPAISGLAPMTGHSQCPSAMSQARQEQRLAYFASQVCLADRQQPNARVDVDQVRLG